MKFSNLYEEVQNYQILLEFPMRQLFTQKVNYTSVHITRNLTVVIGWKYMADPVDSKGGKLV